ncbi:cyclophane-forming radical SAM/SPASM peptide maturase GrrM/OscB [Fischerella sp. PCC 9605]|uniref:cyclophane-forming radical SAM/SPASM peptide maturase GrrM/OscB n=1 Tax=Fischerella sp. PCC 9605 TaxID=1173024 RepID=UPI0004AE48A2|nr:cyclophane-forming radical SAM/SPASM peptide maturase GrrM/OscB [Fischerella sp. PCC 9605]
MTIAKVTSTKQVNHLTDSALSSINLSAFGPIGLVVIQPTSFCNLNCDYCYLPDRQLKNRLSLDLIEPIFETIFTSPFIGRDFTVCWHAGEPLAVPVSFYHDAIAIIQQTKSKYNAKSVRVMHSVQTNGTLINQAWCDCFKQYDIHVGVSIDGPAFIHDVHRQTRKGLGTHAATMRGISLLQKNGICSNVIAVITQDSLDYPDEIFKFFMDNGITDVGFNMEETEGVNQSSSLAQDGVEERYRAFMERFWELIVQANGALKLREFETICSLVYRGDRMNNTDMNKPFVIVSFDSKGNFSTFDPELLSVKTDRYDDFIFGNVLHDTLESACYTEKFQKIYRDLATGIDLCRQTCEYFGVCGGGAGSNKYWEKETFACAETNACRYRIKIVTDIVLEQLEHSLGLIPTIG